MASSKIIVNMIIFFIVIYYSKTKAQNSTTRTRTPLTEELVNLLESLYCTGKADMIPCNIAEGKVCYRESCVSVCLSRSLARCDCPSETRCSVCCTNVRSVCSPASTYGINDAYGLAWFRQNTLDSCNPSIGTSNPQCPNGQDGKICDLKRTALGLEEPWICVNGQCSPLPCTSFNLANQIGSTIAACACRDSYRNYSVCCTDLTNGTCFPFQTWLSAPQGRGYMNAIAVGKTVTLQPVTYPAVTGSTQSGDGDRNSEINCNYVSNEGRKCGNARQCSNGQCRHVCGESEPECYCQPESGYDCHVCCLNAAGVCVSSNKNMSSPSHVKPLGHPCGAYNSGRCSLDGVCQDPSIQRCREPGNEGKICGDESLCRNGLCVHACGVDGKVCYCNPGTNEECHLCCMDQATETCQSANINVTDLKDRIFLPFGQPCNFSSGTCSKNGVCNSVAGHPMAVSFCQRPENEGKMCSMGNNNSYVCIDKTCQPFCQNVSDICVCPTASGQECHLCCRNATTNLCQSVLSQTQPKPRFRSYGTLCDNGRGMCDHAGKCQLLPSSCSDSANEYKRCGERNVCIRGQCQDLCGDEHPCLCSIEAEDPDDQCKICCYTKVNNTCHVASNFAVSLPNLMAKPLGTVCKSGDNEGYCTYNGTCTIIYAMLDQDATRSSGVTCHLIVLQLIGLTVYFKFY